MQRRGVAIHLNLRSYSFSFCCFRSMRIAACADAVTLKPHYNGLCRALFSNQTCCGEWTGLPQGYGPSLQRGQRPHPNRLTTNPTSAQEQPSTSFPHTALEWQATDGIAVDSNGNAELLASVSENEPSMKEPQFDREQFTRSYNIAALRVAADECWDLMQRIKGHLLNWPRLKNVARVPGDDVEEQMQDLFWNTEEKIPDLVQSVREAVYGDGSPSEEVDALTQHSEAVSKFRTKGRLAYPALEGLSRLKRHERNFFRASKKIKLHGKERRLGYSEGKDEIKLATVEVLQDNVPMPVDLEPASLESEKKAWRGPTRLVLLDVRHAGKNIDELPMAVQVALLGSLNGHKKKVFELVQCRLSLHYAYWPLDEILGEVLPARVPVPSAFETVGHIAHLNLHDEHLPYRYMIAQVILDKHFPRIRSVVNKTDAIQSQYRTMQLELLAGSQYLVTTVVEHGLTFHVDLATVYWNTRLATERQRLLGMFDKMDIVCDVFAGVGPLAVAAAKKVKRVYANDLNPAALKYLAKNVVQNKVSAKIELFI
ncbi:hypothetical protein O6H91_03G092200 [Diphasiastrum complanatum]|uniref:Uncharacterized protein n=1 Tax=Diphasiastrum complanatum TaxID=34168 RepID=A0ACC2E9N7_DIPCM|nr:hypothetical protein O6H91_03G092200 [Diphasiastrum complanatum]